MKIITSKHFQLANTESYVAWYMELGVTPEKRKLIPDVHSSLTILL